MSEPHLKDIDFTFFIFAKSSNVFTNPAPYHLPLKSYSIHAWNIFKILSLGDLILP